MGGGADEEAAVQEPLLARSSSPSYPPTRLYSNRRSPSAKYWPPRRGSLLLPVLVFIAFLGVFTLYLLTSPYALSVVLRQIPCTIHLQEKCFAEISRGWSPEETTGSLTQQFQEQCGGPGMWENEMSAFEERQRRVMNGDNTVPVIVWYCDSFSNCHGWGDRLRGLYTTFALALLTDRAFLIKSDRPSPLGLELRPSTGNISFEYEDYSGVLSGSRSEKRLKSDNQLWETLDFYETTDWWSTQADVTWVHSNIPAVDALLLNPSLISHPIVPFLSYISPSSLPGCLTNYLFTPTPRLSEAISDIAAPASDFLDGKQYLTIAIQVRVGDDALEDQTGEKVKKKAEKVWSWHEKCLESIMQELVELEGERDPRLRFFVTSDSILAREHFVNKLSPLGRVDSSASLPSHVNSGSGLGLWGGPAYEDRLNSSIISLRNTLAEWYLLQQSDILISSRSNYASTAALASFLTSPIPPNSRSRSAGAVFEQGNSVCTLQGKERPGKGLEGWWYWCVGEQGKRDRHWGKVDDMLEVRKKWCQRWGWPLEDPVANQP